MPIFISEQLNQYIKDKYEIDLSNDDNITTKDAYDNFGGVLLVYGILMMNILPMLPAAILIASVLV